ncbi:D-alanine--D-alanine ligase [bacterium CG17_big_fil_post_rev_8_21_14_2_50_64_8]|nr:MAG: D-alanine--D-alanine ligase [bacterium CG17_big_fil_post_rev_8_21_14_2_50_64_8]PJA74880.1 MAG: D-alanine--D-alanine ligase [bacterium CG_4_9_14_3_um_filter_65_15]
MKVGLTFDLREEYLRSGYSEEETAEFDRVSTIEALETAIEACGHETERIGHGRDLIRRLASGDRWDLVFNIAEGLHGAGREAQIPAILDLYGIPYTFSGPLVMALTLHKGLTKRVLRDGGIPTPGFAEIHVPSDIDAVDLFYPLFVKPIAEGTGKGIDDRSVVHDLDELRVRGLDLLERFRQPILVEEYLPGREFTVGILGTGESATVLGSMEILLLADAEKGAYTYANKEDSERLVEYRHLARRADPLVESAEDIALEAWRLLEGRDGGRIDLRVDRRGRVQLIEVNPLAGLHPEHSDLPMIATAQGMPYAELIRHILVSAGTRVAAAEAV